MRGAGGPAGTAGRGPAGEVKACVNVLNIVRKRHLQLPTWRGAKGKRSGGGRGASWEQLCRDEDTRQAAARAGACRLYNVEVGALPQTTRSVQLTWFIFSFREPQQLIASSPFAEKCVTDKDGSCIVTSARL